MKYIFLWFPNKSNREIKYFESSNDQNTKALWKHNESKESGQSIYPFALKDSTKEREGILSLIHGEKRIN